MRENQREQLIASLMIQNMNSVPDWESRGVKINDTGLSTIPVIL